MQSAPAIYSEIDCPKNILGRVIGKKGKTIETIERAFAAQILIDQTQDPSRITISGQPGGVNDAAAAVGKLINRCQLRLDSPGAEDPGIERPEGGHKEISGGPFLSRNFVLHNYRLVN